MLWAVWGSLAFFLAVTFTGGFLVGQRALATWRTFKDFTAFLERAGAAVGQRTDAAGRKAGAAGDAASRLTATTGRLSRSLAYARLIADAAGDTGATAVGLRGAVPRK
jgi:hypothetical protein